MSTRCVLQVKSSQIVIDSCSCVLAKLGEIRPTSHICRCSYLQDADFITCKMTLDMSYEQLSNNATYMDAFKTEYAKTVAASLGLLASSVK